eukprot:339270-Hanusia_phi.AAC.7
MPHRARPVSRCGMPGRLIRPGTVTRRSLRPAASPGSDFKPGCSRLLTHVGPGDPPGGVSGLSLPGMRPLPADSVPGPPGRITCPGPDEVEGLGLSKVTPSEGPGNASIRN